MRGKRAPTGDAIRLVRRGAIGFVIGLAIWIVLAPPYERVVAGTAELVLRLAERPAVTRLSPRPGEFILERADFPPAAPRPGLPTADLHFNFVMLATLFALVSPLRPGRVALGLAILFAVHVLALCCQVESLYATRLGPWSEAHYGLFARNAWAAAFHFYQIAGRFAAPFAIWWPLGGWENEEERQERRGREERREAERLANRRKKKSRG